MLLFDITRPSDPRLAKRYYAALATILALPVPARFHESFYRPKKSGGQRKITPAVAEMVIVQTVIARWLSRNLLQASHDYCYTGRGVLAAVDVHRESRYGLVIDLKDAFDQITFQKLQHWISYYQPQLSTEIVEQISELLTFGHTTPQGCVSTPYAFNLVMLGFDRQVSLIAHQLNVIYTRYADNLCFSSTREFGFAKLHHLVGMVIRGWGFQVSWSEEYRDEPIIYLGTALYAGSRTLTPQKLDELYDKIQIAIENQDPSSFKRMIAGIRAWANQVCGSDWPRTLVKLLEEYDSKLKGMKRLID